MWKWWSRLDLGVLTPEPCSLCTPSPAGLWFGEEGSQAGAGTGGTRTAQMHPAEQRSSEELLGCQVISAESALLAAW